MESRTSQAFPQEHAFQLEANRKEASPTVSKSRRTAEGLRQLAGGGFPHRLMCNVMKWQRVEFEVKGGQDSAALRCNAHCHLPFRLSILALGFVSSAKKIRHSTTDSTRSACAFSCSQIFAKRHTYATVAGSNIEDEDVR